MSLKTVTDLQVQEHNDQRINVFIDGAFAVGVSLNTLVREELHIGKALDAVAWQRLQTTERADKALTVALRFLETRGRSIAEVQARLRRGEFAPDVIDTTITRLTELHLLDDLAFSRWWVEQRQRSRPRGVQALRQELYRKGISREIIDQTLADTDLIGSETAQVIALARTVLHKYAEETDYYRFQRRLGGFLLRRGFGFESVRPVVDGLWEEVHRES